MLFRSETTGLADIIRGATAADETATAQQIKSNFTSLRLNEMKDDMSRFACDVLRMKAEIICSKYQSETLIKASGILHTDDVQLVQQAIALLKNEPMRNFNIDIETDTLVLIDQQKDKQERLEFLSAVSGFMKQAMEGAKQQPEMLPLLGELLMFGIRGFKIGRTVEGSFEKFIETAKQQAQNPQPSTEQQKVQADLQATQLKAQIDAQAQQARQQLEAQKFQHDATIEAQQQQMESAKLQLEQWKAQLDADTKIAIAQLQAQNSMKQHVLSLNSNKEQEGLLELNENGDTQPNSALSSLVEAVNANMGQMMAIANQQNQAILQHQADIAQNLNRPKQVVRDVNGKIIGVQ